ncbi:MAG: hypothetical protein ACR2QB_12265 [Gammaproteobacteria bacterium]
MSSPATRSAEAARPQDLEFSYSGILPAFWLEFRTWYFTLKPIEQWRNAWFYRWSGVPLFKRYVPTSGDWIARRRGERAIPPGGYSALRALRNYERRTRLIEWRHLGGFLAMGLGIELTESLLGRTAVVWLWFANIGLNLYPIMLQRYNRLRIGRVLQRVAFKREPTR